MIRQFNRRRFLALASAAAAGATFFDAPAVLQAAGLAPGTLFLPSLLGSREAHAAPAKRIVLFMTRHGPVNSGQRMWQFRGNGLSGDNAADFEFTGNETAQAELLRNMIQQGLEVIAFQGKSETLEDVFMAVTKGVTQ